MIYISKCINYVFIYLLIYYFIINNNIDSIFYNINERINNDIKLYYVCKTSSSSFLSCGRNKTTYKFSIIENKPHTSYLPISLLSSCILYDRVKCSNALIFVGILTRPECIYERMITRKIFEHKNHIKYVFITGLSLNNTINKLIYKEIIMFNDLLYFSVINSYYNCSILMTCFYKYIYNNCKNIKWVMKLDIDTYFNSMLLKKMIKNCNKNISVIGKIKKKGKIKCNTNYKWSIRCSNKSSKYINIPSYPIGPGFLFRFSSIKCINSYYMMNKNIIWIEDILFGLIMKYCNLNYLDISNYTEITYAPKYNLSITKKNVFIHGLYPIEIYLASVKE